MQSLVITSAGQELMTSLITEGATASFTKIATSEHEYSQAELESLTSLEDIKQEVAISKLERKDESTIELLTAATNEELTEGYYVKTLGLYIKDGEENEILYAVAIDDNPDYLPAFDNQAISNIIYRLNIKVSNSAQVTLEIAPDVYATALQVQELSEIVSETKEDLQEQINSHTADTDMHVTQEEKERWDAGGSGGDTTSIEEMLWQGQIAAECQLSDDSQLVTSDGESILLTKKI